MYHPWMAWATVTEMPSHGGSSGPGGPSRWIRVLELPENGQAAGALGTLPVSVALAVSAAR